MTSRPEWHTLVAWRRGPLGALHGQWRDEEIPGASCCSESAALSGPAVAYDARDACRSCVRMALSLGVSPDATVSADPRPATAPKPFDWRTAREVAVRRVEALRAEEDRTGRAVTAATCAELWGTTPAAAHMALRALRKRGAVVRVAYGQFRVVRT